MKTTGDICNLSELNVGQKARVLRLNETNKMIKRHLLDMGVTRGVVITIKKIAPMGDPIDIELRDYELCIGKNDLNKIEKILKDIDWIIKGMEKVFVYTGVAGCGQNRIWQQRFRRYTKSLRQWLELTQVYWNDFAETQTWEDIIYD